MKQKIGICSQTIVACIKRRHTTSCRRLSSEFLLKGCQNLQFSDASSPPSSPSSTQRLCSLEHRSAGSSSCIVSSTDTAVRLCQFARMVLLLVAMAAACWCWLLLGKSRHQRRRRRRRRAVAGCPAHSLTQAAALAAQG